MHDDCCKIKENNNSGFIQGMIYGIIPHTFCIAFILFSAIGAVWATALLKNILEVPYLINIMIIISLIAASVSAIFYLKRCNCLNGKGIKKKWKYLSTLYLVTIVTNILMFSYVLPVLANTDLKSKNQIDYSSTISFKVDVPCSGHAPIIISELKKDIGVKNIIFKNPNIFKIDYNPSETSIEKIKSLEIFKDYKITDLKN